MNVIILQISRSFLLFTGFLALSFSICFGERVQCNGHLYWGVPGKEDQILCREAYAVGYSYYHKTPLWVSYHLTPGSISPRFERSSRFFVDKEINPAHRAELKDYYKSGFDRGHMAPAATVDSSRRAMLESFLLSNMVPQKAGLNRQGWRYLEEYVRHWTYKKKDVYVVTGPIYIGDEHVIGNGVHIADGFYKVLLAPRQGDSLAFIVPHRKIKKEDIPLMVTSIDKVEALTGLDFWSSLPEDKEVSIEASTGPFWR